MATMADIAKKVGVSKGTVSKALNGAPDVSETLRKTILETAVELGYTRARRGAVRTLAVFIENMSCAQPEDFGTDIVTGFRQMAEPAGYEVRVIELNEALQKAAPFDEYMLQEGCLGALLLGLSLEDPWLKGFYTSHTPAVLYDNLVQPNPTVATLGMDNNEAIGQAVAALRAMGHCKVGYLSSALGSHIYRVRYQSFFNALRGKRPTGRSGPGRHQLFLLRDAGRPPAPPAGAGGHGHFVQLRPAGPHGNDPLPGAGATGAAGYQHRRL